MKKLPTTFLLKLFIVLLFFTNSFNCFSQATISKPTFNFPFICGSEIFNRFDFNYTFNPASFFAGTTFNLIISDANGVFPATSNIVATSLSTGSTTNMIRFVLPTTFVGGNSYKFKVQSTTSPVITSPESNQVQAYYKIFQSNFSINNFQSLTLCGETPGLLSIDDPTAEPTSITYLKYNWYRNDILIPNQKDTSLIVTLSGAYYCQVDYGSTDCTNPSGDRGASSNEVVVNISTGGQNTVITSSTGNVVIEGVPATLSTENNELFFYQWYKDNNILDGQTTTSLTTDIEGEYFLEIYSGICTSRSNKILLELKKPSLATVIPNLISPNNDGVNDFWEIPEIYNSGIVPDRASIAIRDSNGKIVFETDNYINDWPQSEFNFDSINPVFYYTINAKNGDIKKGTITIVK